MPDGKPPQPDDQTDKGGGDPAELLAAIERDFSSLVETFERLLHIVGDTDRGAATALWTAHSAAKRGVQLSERLSKLRHNDNDKS